MTKTETHNAYHISVDCVRNDPVDVKCGGPQFLGFDFMISADEDSEETINFIKSELNRANKPLYGGIHCSDSACEVNTLWDRERIAKCIQEDGMVPEIGSRDHERSKRGYR